MLLIIYYHLYYYIYLLDSLKQGNSSSLISLVDSYDKGSPLTKDISKEEALLKLFYLHTNTKYSTWLANLYYTGNGVIKNYPKAYAFALIANSNNDLPNIEPYVTEEYIEEVKISRKNLLAKIEKLLPIEIQIQSQNLADELIKKMNKENKKFYNIEDDPLNMCSNLNTLINQLN